MSMSNLWLTFSPAVFVLIWSTGYLGARMGSPYVEPMTFLCLRFTAVAILLTIAALVVRRSWPRGADLGHATVSGLLVHAIYLGGVFAAIHQGLHLGVAALVVGLQPLLTAALAFTLLKEPVTRQQAAGLLLGFCGLAVVVWQGRSTGTVTPTTLAMVGASLLGITLGTLYQKRFCSQMPMLTGNAVQFTGAAVATGTAAWLLETRDVDWTPEFMFALGWLVLVLSIGAVTLLYQMIRRGAAARVSSLFYLVPPVTAVSGWMLFDQPITTTALAGMLLAAIGVALVMRQPGSRDATV